MRFSYSTEFGRGLFRRLVRSGLRRSSSRLSERTRRIRPPYAGIKLPLPVIATCRGKEQRRRIRRIDRGRNPNSEVRRRKRRQIRRYRLPIRRADFWSLQSSRRSTTLRAHLSDLTSLMERICAGPGDIAKVATMVNSWADNRRLLDLISNAMAETGDRHGYGGYRSNHPRPRSVARTVFSPMQAWLRMHRRPDSCRCARCGTCIVYRASSHPRS